MWEMLRLYTRPESGSTFFRRLNALSVIKMKRIVLIFLVQASFIFTAIAAPNSRLAIGTFGLTPEKRDADLVDLVTARMTGVSGFDLVERRELEAVLKEASINRSGMVRAKEAARVGGLVHADLFLVGSAAAIDGTNWLFVRLVDARSGEIRSLTVVCETGKRLDDLAGQIAEFVRAQGNQPARGRCDYLAIGVVQNLGVNNRFADFPAQLRGEVLARLGTNVVVLERDVVSYLASEMQLDQAGLTENSRGNPAPVQFGFWIVDGFYQSYEVAVPEVQLKLRVERVNGTRQTIDLQGKPDETFFKQVCETLAGSLNRSPEPGPVAPPTRKGEIAALEERGRQLVGYLPTVLSMRLSTRFMYRTIEVRSALNPDKIMNALEEATRVYESILLLDSENNAAKMRLAGCLLFEAEDWGGIARAHFAERSTRAQELYREVIASEDPSNSVSAQVDLAYSLDRLDGVALLRRFAAETTNRAALAALKASWRDLLWEADITLPRDSVLPELKFFMLDQMRELRRHPTEPIEVSFDEILMMDRFNPRVREKIINACLPDFLAQNPDLKPYILLAAAAEQTETNSPVIAQFLASLRECEERPESVWLASNYFSHLSSTREDEKEVKMHGGTTQYQRTFENRQYALVVTMALARQRAALKNLAPPLTEQGKLRLAESYLNLKQWKPALDLFDELPSASMEEKNECRRHLQMEAINEELPEAAWKSKSDLEKVGLAYQCADRQQWSNAVAIMESIGHRTVRMNRGGPWGLAFAPVLPTVVASEWRARNGMTAVSDPTRFELGARPYVSFSRNGYRVFAFEVEGEDLWMATYSEIKKFAGDGPFSAAEPSELHEFDRGTHGNITSLCVGPEYVWAGTEDDGLLELNRKTGSTRRLTKKQGLPLDGICGLVLRGRCLWIAYQNEANGAVGNLNLDTLQLSTLTPKLPANAGANSQPWSRQAKLDLYNQAPTLPVASMANAGPEEIWFAVYQKGVQRFRESDGKWSVVYVEEDGPNDVGFPAIAADTNDALMLLARRESDVLAGAASSKGGLMIYDLRNSSPGMDGVIGIRSGLPSNDVTAVAADGRIAWVGGRGFVAVVDVVSRKVLRVAYVSASRIYGIRLSARHAWIGVSTGAGDSDPEYSGDAWTGVYRLDRSAIEPRQ